MVNSLDIIFHTAKRTLCNREVLAHIARDKLHLGVDFSPYVYVYILNH